MHCSIHVQLRSLTLRVNQKPAHRGYTYDGRLPSAESMAGRTRLKDSLAAMYHRSREPKKDGVGAPIKTADRGRADGRAGEQRGASGGASIMRGKRKQNRTKIALVLLAVFRDGEGRLFRKVYV